MSGTAAIVGNYEETPIERPEGDVQVAVSSRGVVRVVLSDGDGTETPLQVGFTAQQITSKTTTNVKTGAGTIGSIIVNKSGSADTITVYDATSATGTPIATIEAPTVGMAFCVGYNFGVGLTIVTGGTTAGNYTVAYA